MMESRKETRIFDQVKVINFPFRFGKDGKKVYSLLSEGVVKNVIEEIPESIRPYTILDYEKIPPSYFFVEIFGMVVGVFGLLLMIFMVPFAFWSIVTALEIATKS